VPRFQINVHTDRSPVSTIRHPRDARRITTSRVDIPRRHHHRRRRRPRPRRRVHERTVTFTTSPWTNHPRSTKRLRVHGRCTPLSHTPSRVPPPTPHAPPSSIARAVDARCRLDTRWCWIPKPYTYTTDTRPIPFGARCAIDAIRVVAVVFEGWFSRPRRSGRDAGRPTGRATGRARRGAEKTVRFDRANGRSARALWVPRGGVIGRDRRDR